MMLEPLYVNRVSLLHRLPAALKLAVLLAAGLALFAVHDLRWLGGAAGLAALLAASTGVRVAALWRQVRALVWILAAIGAFAAWFQGWLAAAEILLRLCALVGLALAVTFSTRTSELVAVCEKALLPLERRGLLDAGKVALALALALRFVPEIWRHYLEIREAQAARGLDRHPLALLVPLIVRTLKRADQVAQAIDARG